MKTLASLLLLVLGAVSAPAQVLDSASINLAATGTTTISTTATNGTVNNVACHVSTGPDGSLTGTLKVSLNGGTTTTNYTLYNNSVLIADAFLPYTWEWPTSNAPSFVLPLNVGYSLSGLKVTFNVSVTAASAGTLICSVMHT